VRLLGPGLALVQSLLQGNNAPLVTSAAWAMADLTTHSTEETCQAVLDGGIVPLIVSNIRAERSSLEVLLPCVRTLGNICSSTDAHTDAIVQTGVLGHLGPLMRQGDKPLSREVCWALSNITAGSAPLVQAVLDAKLLQPLIELLQSSDDSVAQEALWALCNCTTSGTFEQIQFLVASRCLPPITAMLERNDTQLSALALEGSHTHAHECTLDTSRAAKAVLRQGCSTCCAQRTPRPRHRRRRTLLLRCTSPWRSSS